MKVDSELMFECLIYINAYYYPVFASCESIMALAKYISPLRDTPNIGQDAAVCFTRLFVEVLKLVVFNRYKDKSKKLVTAFAVLMTSVTIATIFYTLLIQDPAIKLEKVLSSLTIILTVFEVAFGTLFLLSCYKRVEYY
ncbi:uncharacterized protein LOC108911729 [Anoplophora glabripennis]|uniref:uncharacterized protein LOC108911729 n=1 Tax=Anoplophora glabripennis TaxID=217634 RepID=UPI0008748648|nr:uncharacterized protein LOC108911729 [Anoplophora glabripennis]